MNTNTYETTNQDRLERMLDRMMIEDSLSQSWLGDIDPEEWEQIEERASRRYYWEDSR